MANPSEYVFKINLKVFDPQSLRKKALAHPDVCEDQTFLTEDGDVDVEECLIMILDPGSLTGCSIHDSSAEEVSLNYA